MRAKRPPAAAAPPTQRAGDIAEQNAALDAEMQGLEASTRVRNEELYKHLLAIETRGRRWEAKLRVEVEERERRRHSSSSSR